jgi:hypothetical protein
MRTRTSWARITALAASLTIIASGLPAVSAFAQEAPSEALEQARSGEDGTSGAGATPGNTSTGNAERDSHGNGRNASAGDAGAGGTTETADAAEAPLPENAELLEALGILGLAATYDLTVLSDSDIPLTLLPPPPAESVPAEPTDINTGGQGLTGETSGEATIDESTTGETSTISTEPGSGAAPASGSTGTAAEDGVGATDNGERPRDRTRNSDGATEAPGG